MKNKLIWTRIAKILCLLLCVLILSGACLSLCFYHDYTGILMAGLFREPEDTVDVVILGASEAYIDYSAAYAYDLYGFTSYPYAWDAATGMLYEAQVKEVLKRQNPKWIVVEINGILYDEVKDATNPNSLRIFLDHTPIGVNKLQTMAQFAPREDWYHYLFPLAKYHENWKNAYDQGGLLRDLLSVKKNGSVLKGYVTNVMPYDAPESRDVSQDFSTEPLEPNSEAQLISFLEFCRENNLDNVLFVRFPHIIASDWNYQRFQRCNQAEAIIESYGFPFVNMERDYKDIGLDFAADFYNDDHLNFMGQQKLTAYFGKILTEEYGLQPSVLTPQVQENWKKSAEYIRLFHDFCRERMENGQYDVYYETRAILEQLEARKP